MDGVVVAVERSIATELTSRFGIMLDGWTNAFEHYIAVFACYEVNDNLPAESHLDFLATMMPRDFGVQLEQCRFIVGDNCSVNRRMATLMEVPHMGCASHRLNMAVQDHMASHEGDLAAIQALMIKLRTLTQSANFGDEVEFDLSMIKRYVELSEFIDVEDDDIMELLPAPAPFAAATPDNARENMTDGQESFVESLRNRRRLGEESVEYEQRKSIPPMPNVVERFLSVARVKFGHQRHGLLPRTLEAILFLRENCEYWDASTVDSLQ
ncbi:Ribonuclease H-like domain [Phytophthora cactorum]|nr:Ribonuclease H-like domain [Phytophthora cactorum]